MTVESLPKQKTSWPMLMLGAGLIAAVLALAAAYNAFSLGEEALVQTYLQHLDAFPKNLQELQVVLAAPASRVNLELRAGESIKGLWSSESLEIRVGEASAGITENKATLSKEKSWDADIQHNAIFERHDPIFINTGFTLDSDALVGTEQSALIEGRIIYPVIAAGGGQEDAAQTLFVPFVIRVVAPAEIAEAVRAKAKTTLSITGSLAVIFIAVPSAYFRKHRKPRGKRPSGPASGAK